MGAISNYYGTRVLNTLLSGESITPPSAVWLCLYTTEPGASDVGTEVSGGGYTRVGVTGQFTAAAVSGGKATVSNSAKIAFTAATGDWTTANYWALRTASSAGNLICYAPLSTAKTVSAGDVPSFDVGALTVTLE